MPNERAAYHASYYAENRERIKARVKAREERLKDDPDFQEARRQYQQKYHRTTGRDTRLRKQYGVSDATFDQMLADQGGCCAICGTNEPGGRGTFHVDHDHVTNKVRGLLCSNCNLMLGHAKDDPGVLYKAVEYLEKPR